MSLDMPMQYRPWISSFIRILCILFGFSISGTGCVDSDDKKVDGVGDISEQGNGEFDGKGDFFPPGDISVDKAVLVQRM